MVEVLHAPHPELGGLLLVGGEHFTAHVHNNPSEPAHQNHFTSKKKASLRTSFATAGSTAAAEARARSRTQDGVDARVRPISICTPMPARAPDAAHRGAPSTPAELMREDRVQRAPSGRWNDVYTSCYGSPTRLPPPPRRHTLRNRAQQASVLCTLTIASKQLRAPAAARPSRCKAEEARHPNLIDGTWTLALRRICCIEISDPSPEVKILVSRKEFSPDLMLVQRSTPATREEEGFRAEKAQAGPAEGHSHELRTVTVTPAAARRILRRGLSSFARSTSTQQSRLRELVAALKGSPCRHQQRHAQQSALAAQRMCGPAVWPGNGDGTRQPARDECRTPPGSRLAVAVDMRLPGSP